MGYANCISMIDRMYATRRDLLVDGTLYGMGKSAGNAPLELIIMHLNRLFPGRYDINHVLLMGRVTSGQGGDLVLAKAQEVLKAEYPELKMQVNLPDEKSRRVGQSVAAASLPKI